MNSHRDEPACIIDARPESRPGPGPEFDQLLEASSLGTPDVLRHEAMTPPSFFAELDAALDEDYANEAKEQPRAEVREGDVDDALLRLIERGAQSAESPPPATPDGTSSRPTWTYPIGSFAARTCLHSLDETDHAGEQLIRLWYLPPAESRVFVSFVEYERPSKVRALLSALLASNQGIPSTSVDWDWNVNVFSYLREDVARSMVSIGLAHQDGFEPIVQACSSAIEASHISDEVDHYLLTDCSGSLSLHSNVAELRAGPTYSQLETSEPSSYRRWRALSYIAIFEHEEQMPATNTLLVPIAPDRRSLELARGRKRWAIERSQSSSPERSVSNRLWVCVRNAAVDHSYPVVLVVAPLISTATLIAFVFRR